MVSILRGRYIKLSTQYKIIEMSQLYIEFILSIYSVDNSIYWVDNWTWYIEFSSQYIEFLAHYIELLIQY